MSRNYDNWERLVAAVIKKNQIWELCHQQSRTPSICSDASSSDFSSRSYFQESSDVMLDNNRNSAKKPIPRFVPSEGVLKRTRKLGKGRFGTSILTQLRRGVQLSDQDFLAEGTQLVMKKLRSKVVNVTEEEFKRVFGNCRHENVAAPRAYYFSSEGNYIFNDYHRQGSVYDMLHGKSNDSPDWESRVKIAIGAGRGIAHIHGQYGALGNIKSSNIFVNSEQYGCVSDICLGGIMIRAGKWGEYKLKNASDVYSFGVVLLELVTGKSGVEPQGAGIWRNHADLVEWAQHWSSNLIDQKFSDPRSEWGFLVDEIDMLNFHRELKGKIRDEKVEMLQVAEKCMVKLPQDRPEMFEVVLMLENMYNKPRSRIITKFNCCQLRLDEY